MSSQIMSPSSCGYNCLVADDDHEVPSFSFSESFHPASLQMPSFDENTQPSLSTDADLFGPVSLDNDLLDSLQTLSPPEDPPAISHASMDFSMHDTWGTSLHPLSMSSQTSSFTAAQTFTPMAAHTIHKPVISSPHQMQTGNAYQPHFGDHPSRTLYIQHPMIFMLSPDDLQTIFGQFGDLRAIFTDAAQTHQYILVSYYDIRHAKNAVRRLVGYRYQNVCMDIHYSIPVGVEAVQNQGTLVVFNLDQNIANEELARLFGTYGELKEIRETPNKKHHRFIEFFDVREAEAAMTALNRKEIGGKRIKIESSRPGGARRNMVQRVQPMWAPPQEALHLESMLLAH